jgi:hypothetical protein
MEIPVRQGSAPTRAGRRDRTFRFFIVPIVRRALIPIAAFALGVGIAELAGAVNLGTAFGVGQIVFAVTLVAVILWM